MKTQNVRLADVFLLGPFMMWAASRNQLTKLEKNILYAAGLATIAYNWRNYLTERALSVAPIPPSEQT